MAIFNNKGVDKSLQLWYAMGETYI